ncbi:hypothetical protein D3C81_1627020 [compost metagenome]
MLGFGPGVEHQPARRTDGLAIHHHQGAGGVNAERLDLGLVCAQQEAGLRLGIARRQAKELGLQRVAGFRRHGESRQVLRGRRQHPRDDEPKQHQAARLTAKSARSSSAERQSPAGRTDSAALARSA